MQQGKEAFEVGGRAVLRPPVRSGSFKGRSYGQMPRAR